MAEAGVAGMGRLTLSRRERMVMVEPRGSGMALFTLRAAQEVQPAQFGSAEGDLDVEMVAIARSIIRQRMGDIRPEHVPRPLSRGITGADRSQAEGPPHQTPRGHHAATGDRSDGGPETQSRTGNACNRRHDTQAKASQASSGSAPAVIASTASRRPKKGGARDRAGSRRHETAKGPSAARQHL